jgi:hypothetical protein
MEKYLQTGLEKSLKQKVVTKQPEIIKKITADSEKKENKSQNQYVDYESDESRK